MRHFALTNLKDFGMGKKACEEKIIEESKMLTNEFKAKQGIYPTYWCENQPVVFEY